MATINGIQTIGTVWALSVASDPSAGGGTVAPIGSFAGLSDGNGFYSKTGAGDTAWSKLATLTGGLLPASQGGTGVNNGVNTLTFNGVTSITGGGTVDLGGFTLTVPATGTVPLGTGNSGRVVTWNGANTITSSSSFTYTSNALTNTVSANGNTVMQAVNSNAGGAATAYLRASNGTAMFDHIQYGTGFTTAGLLVANLSHISTNSAVGMLYSSTAASTTFTWAIGGTGTANQYLSLSTTALTLADGVNVVTGTTTGSIIFNTTSQKGAFWGKTPVIQPAAANQAALTNSTGGTYDGTLADVGIVFSQSILNNNFTDLYTLLDEIRTALVNTGIIKGSA